MHRRVIVIAVHVAAVAVPVQVWRLRVELAPARVGQLAWAGDQQQGRHGEGAVHDRSVEVLGDTKDE